LGLPKAFNCIFHEDTNPSANIYQDPNTGYYWYKCFSEGCGVVKDIISITENLLKCNTPKALRFLRDVYNIKFAETDWQKERREILEANIRLLMDTERLQIIAPETYKRIKRYIPDLIVINSFAIEKIYTENFTDNNGIPIFFASLRFLKKICGHSDQKRISNIVSLFTFLGLLNKPNQTEIPTFLLEESRHQAALKHQKNVINYYSIPSYCDEILTFSEYKSIEFKSKGLTMRGLGWELFYRTLGKDEADRVFPQLQGKQLSESGEEFAYKVDRLVMRLIAKQGYTMQKQIIESFEGNKEVIKSRLKRVIPETLDKYDLICIKANNNLKKKFSIDCRGYPNIIIKNNDFDTALFVKEISSMRKLIFNERPVFKMIIV
jgi:hypothetical protein